MWIPDMIAGMLQQSERERRIDEAVRRVLNPMSLPCILERPSMYGWIQLDIVDEYRRIVEREEGRA